MKINEISLPTNNDVFDIDSFIKMINNSKERGCNQITFRCDAGSATILFKGDFDIDIESITSDDYRTIEK